MRFARLSRLFTAVCVVGALAASAVMARTIEIRRGPEAVDDAVYMHSAKLIKFLSMGFTGLAASLYWTRAVQYFGRKHYQSSREYSSLAPLLDLTTQLDPHLVIAYEFGSIFLAQKPPEGAGQPEEAVRLVERGIRENPDAWRLHAQLGYIQYLELQDPLAAAASFERGSQVPGAYPWMKIMAAMLRHRAGDIETSTFLWRGLFESSDDPQIKSNAAVHLLALRVDQEVNALQNAVGLYHQRHGRSPLNWFELIQANVIHHTPLDPLGRPYLLTSDGRVEVNDYRRFPFITKGLPVGAHPTQFIDPSVARSVRKK